MEEQIIVENHPLIRPMHAQNELKWFVFVSALDIFATYILLYDGNFVESNPIARFFINGWGMKGMIYFKLGMVALICTIAHVVSLERPVWSQRLLQFATIVVAIVVAYSALLLIRHGNSFRGPVEEEMDLGRHRCPVAVLASLGQTGKRDRESPSTCGDMNVLAEFLVRCAPGDRARPSDRTC